MLGKVLPHPLLSLALALVWLGLVNTVSLGHLILAAGFGVVIPMMTAAYWPERPRVRNPIKVAEYVLIVLWDIVVANVQVAAIILFRRDRDIRSAYITVPIELTSPEAITVLAGTITMTPGTVSAMLCADGASILVHALHAPDPDGTRDAIKERYERRLKEIFE